MPPQNLQIEFLNRWRNADRYPADDPLAPQRVPFDYCFAITMMAQPLAWFEATGLPEEAFAIAPLIRTYRAHQERIHAGQIFPIGEEPSGTGWTGFQSLRGDEGYLIVYREHNDRSEARLKLWNVAGRTIHCTLVAGQGHDFSAAVDASGEVAFAARPAVLVRVVCVSHQPMMSPPRHEDTKATKRMKHYLWPSCL